MSSQLILSHQVHSTLKRFYEDFQRFQSGGKTSEEMLLVVKALADAIGQPLSDIERWANERVLTVDADGLPEWDQSWLDNLLAEIVDIPRADLAALRELLQDDSEDDVGGGLVVGRVMSIGANNNSIDVRILGDSTDTTVFYHARSLDFSTVGVFDTVMLGRGGFNTDTWVAFDVVESVFGLVFRPGAVVTDSAGNVFSSRFPVDSFQINTAVSSRISGGSYGATRCPGRGDPHPPSPFTLPNTAWWIDGIPCLAAQTTRFAHASTAAAAAEAPLSDPVTPDVYGVIGSAGNMFHVVFSDLLDDLGVPVTDYLYLEVLTSAYDPE